MKKSILASAAALILSSAVLTNFAGCSSINISGEEKKQEQVNETAAALKKLEGDADSVSYSQENDTYTIDGTKVTSGWKFAHIDLSEFSNETVRIEFSALMQVENRSGSAVTLNWNVNVDGFPIVGQGSFAAGTSDWINVSKTTDVELKANNLLYLSNWNLKNSDYTIRIRNLEAKIISLSGKEEEISGLVNPDNGASIIQRKLSSKDLKTVANNNPVTQTKFTADPAVLVYNDTVYIYGTNDSQEAEVTKCKKENSYGKIKSLNIYASKDLVNWEYKGEASIEGSRWAHNSWAPAICTKRIDGKDKFFLYFADNGSGIGVLTADSPEGPFTDPLGTQLISRKLENVANVEWLFDPAVFIDDDGKAYLYFGGGVPASCNPAHPMTGRCIELGDDMISVKGVAKTIDAPWLFEDSGINKFNGKYYYSYCTNWNDRAGDAGAPPRASIAYMVSDNPLGPFEYQGYTMTNPNNGNNHHWIFTFRGKNYIAYHTQKISENLGLGGGSYRNVYISDFNVGTDIKLPMQKPDTSFAGAGVEQSGSFNPYETVRASTMHSCLEVAVLENKNVVSTGNSSYICIKGADLSKGVTSFDAEFAKTSTAGTISVYIDDMTKKPAASASTKGKTRISSFAKFAGDSSKHNIYIRMSGDAELVSWKFN